MMHIQATDCDLIGVLSGKAEDSYRSQLKENEAWWFEARDMKFLPGCHSYRLANSFGEGAGSTAQQENIL